MQYDKYPFKSATLLGVMGGGISSDTAFCSTTDLFNIQEWEVLRQEIWHQVWIGICWLVWTWEMNWIGEWWTGMKIFGGDGQRCQHKVRVSIFDRSVSIICCHGMGICFRNIYRVKRRCWSYCVHVKVINVRMRWMGTVRNIKGRNRFWITFLLRHTWA